MIKFYKTNAPYGFLNNFKKCNILIYGREWKWVEAPYQFRKTEDKEYQELIWAAKTPREARDIGQECDMIPNWDKIKVGVMKECVMAKFTQNDDLKELLLATGDDELVEDSPVDNFWGCGKDGKGLNMLGKILMEVRNGQR